MVSKWWTPQGRDFTCEIPHQSKIYTESNQSDFPRFFARLISMQTLAIYRRLLSQGLIARDQAQRDQKETARVARCFFCSAWRSGSGWCSCCCPERKRLNRK